MSDATKSAGLNYATYLELDGLLQLQQPQSSPPEHDEMLFIIIHQVHELWFKEMLHELDLAGRQFRGGDLWGVVAALKRVRMILKTLVGQVDILETMTPESFESFRSRLDTSSGFQSMQFREIEFKLGLKRAAVLDYMPDHLHGRDAAVARFNAPSLVDDFYHFLATQGVEVPAEVLDRDPTMPMESSDVIEDLLEQLARHRPDMNMLFETMLDIDEGLQEWRYRHVQLVRRTIGDKTGTGGSPGVEYLKKTVYEPAFPDLWAIRARF